MPKVSVIVPIYQVEAYLPACLDSILAQSFKDYELILVNDGTRDHCPSIMADYAQRDKRVRQVHKANGGLSSARNAGLDVAHGEYIAFLDSDDTAEPDWLADTVAAAEQNHADLVLFNYRKVTAEQRKAPFLAIRDEVIDIDTLGLANYFYRYWMPYVHGQEAWCRLYRRDIIEENGLRFAPNDEIFAEDTLFSAMYLLHVQRMAALSKSYVNYLQRGDSLMNLAKPHLAQRLMTLSVRLCCYAQQCDRGEALKNVLPVLCYDKLICKGIRYDPSQADVMRAMGHFRQDETMKALLEALAGPWPLLLYTLKTGKGFRTQIRGRMFARRWLRGDVSGAITLVEGRHAE